MRGAEHLGNVLVLGLGKSGKSAARYCAALLGTRVDALFIAAGARNDDSVAFVESLAEEIGRICHPERSGGQSPRFLASLGMTDLQCHAERSAQHFPFCHPERSAQRGVEGSPRSGATFSYAFGDDALEGDIGRFDLCIASPGIPFWHELYVRGAELSDELISEVEFAWRESDEDSVWVAITGTNGKTTTTSLTAHVLRECGFAADAVGNIGAVCLDAVAAGGTQVYVAEVSSYQLYSTRHFAPDVAVLLNITPDHIHWHQTLEAYAEAKFNILGMMHEGGASASFSCDAPAPLSCIIPCCILDATNDVVRAKVREMRAAGRTDYVPMGTAEGIHGDMRAKCGAANAAFLDGEGVLRVALGGVEHALGAACDLQVKGEHNASNALAAAAVAVALGADDAAIARALASFKPLAHRIEPCGSVAGVECYNDSKATNVDATCKALQAFPGKRVVIMLGGDDKGTDLSELVAATHAHAGAAVCYGEGGPRFYRALTETAPASAQTPADTPSPAQADPVGAQTPAPAAEGGTPQAPETFTCLMAGHMEDAFDAALALARPGDVVLLSPACASFDEFRSFEHRGDVFKQLVAARAEAQGA